MIDWKKVAIAIGSGFAIVMSIVIIYSILFPPEISCLRFYPDGSSKALFGEDCSKPD